MIVVTGATGTVGRHVVAGLVDDGCPVRAVTRDARASGFPGGAHTVVADPTRPETLVPALAGASALFLSPPAVRGAAPEVLRLAREHGVGHVVVLSSASVEEEAGEAGEPGDSPIARFHRAIEDAVTASGIPATRVRPDMFASNTIRFWGPRLREGDVVRAAYGDAALAPVDECDVAALCVAALTGRVDAGTAHRLTGPETLTHRAMVGILASATGRPLRFVELGVDEAHADLVRLGIPPEMADATLDLHRRATVRPTRLSPLPYAVAGRAPSTFADWAARRAPAFRRAEPAAPSHHPEEDPCSSRPT